MKRVAAAVAGLLLLASSTGAAPLCRDLKGLLSPCATNPGARATATGSTAHRAAQATERARSDRIRFSRLCRDTKGLATPCT